MTPKELEEYGLDLKIPRDSIAAALIDEYGIWSDPVLSSDQAQEMGDIALKALFPDLQVLRDALAWMKQADTYFEKYIPEGAPKGETPALVAFRELMERLQ